MPTIVDLQMRDNTQAEHLLTYRVARGEPMICGQFLDSGEGRIPQRAGRDSDLNSQGGINGWLRVVLLSLAVIITGFTESGGHPAAAQPSSPNCGITAVLALAQVLDKNVSEDIKARFEQMCPKSTVSLLDVQGMSSLIGIAVVGAKTGLAELVASQRPAIIHLSNPDHFALLLDGSKDHVRLVPGPGSPVLVVPRPEIEKRFDGYAMILKDTPPADSPHIRLDETDLHFGICGIGQRIQQEYQFTNTGKKDLVVTVSGST